MNSNDQRSIEELIYDETEKRLNEMSCSDYDFPARITKSDIFAMAAGVLVSLMLIALCMIGVIV